MIFSKNGNIIGMRMLKTKIIWMERMSQKNGGRNALFYSNTTNNFCFDQNIPNIVLKDVILKLCQKFTKKEVSHFE